MAAYQLFEGTKTPLVIEPDGASEQFVLHLIDKRTRRILAKYSYPERQGYTLAVKTDNNYTVVVLPSVTKGMANQTIRMDFWFKMGESFSPTASQDLAVVEDTTTKNIEPV